MKYFYLCHSKIVQSHKKKEESYHQQIELEFKEETSELSLECSFVWCRNVNTSESRS
jgi:hypothetical protein